MASPFDDLKLNGVFALGVADVEKLLKDVGVAADKDHIVMLCFGEGTLEKRVNVIQLCIAGAGQAKIKVARGAAHGGNVAQVDCDSFMAERFAVSPIVAEMNTFDE